jgi:biopolymer transport protein ExbB
MGPMSATDALLGYVQQGGFVMPPLVLATCVLWYVIGLRAVALRRGSRWSLPVLLEQHRQGSQRPPRGVIDAAVMIATELSEQRLPAMRHQLDDRFAELQRRLRSGRTIIHGIVASAPLLGLLGTVTGMIETFDSLADMALFAQSGGIAGGISQALFTTQMGLVVAVPGVVLGRLLDRRQTRLEEELSRIKSIFCIAPCASTLAAPEPGGS